MIHIKQKKYIPLTKKKFFKYTNMARFLSHPVFDRIDVIVQQLTSTWDRGVMVGVQKFSVKLRSILA